MLYEKLLIRIDLAIFDSVRSAEIISRFALKMCQRHLRFRSGSMALSGTLADATLDVSSNWRFLAITAKVS